MIQNKYAAVFIIRQSIRWTTIDALNKALALATSLSLRTDERAPDAVLLAATNALLEGVTSIERGFLKGFRNCYLPEDLQ